MKNIFTKILPIIILFSGIQIVNASTRIIVFKNSPGTHTMSIAVDYGLDKEEYKTGETPYINKNFSIGHFACANGATVDRNLQISPIFEIGSPNNSENITILATNEAPSGLYYNTKDNWIYYNNVKVIEYPNIDSFGYEIVHYNNDGSNAPIINLVLNNGKLEGNYLAYCRKNDMSNLYYYKDNECWTLNNNSYVHNASGQLLSYGFDNIPNQPLNIFTPSINLISLPDKPIKSNTYVYGITGIPNSFKIPNSATLGSYVAQITFTPSWVQPSPKTPISGIWNSLQTKVNTIPDKYPISTIAKILNIKTAKANMYNPPELFVNDGGGGITEPGGGGGGGGNNTSNNNNNNPCVEDWWCDIIFNEIKLSEPFIITSQNIAPSIMIK